MRTSNTSTRVDAKDVHVSFKESNLLAQVTKDVMYDGMPTLEFDNVEEAKAFLSMIREIIEKKKNLQRYREHKWTSI